MTHPPAPRPVDPADSNFLLWREVDRLERMIDTSGRRIDHLDEHGSRGVDALRTQIEQVRKDFLDHENMHTEAARLAVQARRWTIGVVVGLITPLYPLIWAVLVR